MAKTPEEKIAAVEAIIARWGHQLSPIYVTMFREALDD